MTKPFLKRKTENKLENKFKIFVWTLFDFANTSYSIVIVTFVFAVYFKETIVSGKSVGDLYWSFGVSISMVITAIISPILGAIADHSTGKKRFLLTFTLLCIISTALLFFTGEGDIFLALLLFVLANIGFEAGLVFYDSFLPEITKPKNYGRVSGCGFAFGYMGSLAILAIIYPFIQSEMIKEIFPIAAAFFLIFSIPLFIFLDDNRKEVVKEESFLIIGFKRVYTTLTHLKYYKNLALFLLAYFFYIEGVNTVIFFSGNYAVSTLNFSMSELILFFIIVQTTAILGSVTFGIIADSFGQKNTIITSLLIWLFTISGAFIISDQNGSIVLYFVKEFSAEIKTVQVIGFYIVGLFAGSVMGATQSVSRSLMSKLTPFDKKTEFFGFYSFFGKSSAVLGPLVFGYLSFVTGSQPFAILSLGAFFVIGLIVLSFVKDVPADLPEQST